MSFYNARRAGKPINPAIAFYNHSYKLLTSLPSCKEDSDGRLISSVRYGSSWSELHFWYPFMDGKKEPASAKPPIALGGRIVNSDGTFQMHTCNGWKQRGNVSRNFFLSWTYVHGQYVWFVDTSAEDGHFQGTWGAHDFMNFNAPKHYYPEKLLGERSWSCGPPWLKLAWDDDHGWVIAFARSSPGIKRIGYAEPTTKDDFDKFDLLRAKRYRRYEREHLVSTGVITRRQRTYLTEEQVEERREKTLEVIVANFDVTTLARTVPLKKEDEAQWALPGFQ